MVGVAVLTVAVYLVGLGGARTSWVEQVSLDVVMVRLSMRVAIRAAENRPMRRFWWSMAAGGCLFTLGDGIQMVRVLSHAASGPADFLQPALIVTGVGTVVFHMLTYPLQTTGRARLRLWLDAATVLTAVAVFIWYFLIGGALGKAGSAEMAFATAGSVIMLVSAFGLVKLLLSGAAPFSYAAGVAGVTSVVGTAVGTALSSVSDGRAVMVGDLLACVAFASVPRIQELQMRAWTTPLGPRRRRTYSRLPYVAVIATQALLIGGLVNAGISTRTWGVAYGLVGITTLVLSRQLLAFHDNTALVASLDASMVKSRELQDKLRHKATHDTLTHLANRALFDERIQAAQLIEERDGGEVSIIMIDLDDFKTINDTLGHSVGDGVLVAVAARFRQCVRDGDTLARLGGDEFAVLLPGAALAQAEQVAHRIVNALTEPLLVDGHPLTVRASIGVVAGTLGTADGLLRDADAAMYLVKHNGKGGYQVAEPAAA